MARRIFTDQEEFEISKNYLNGKSLGDLAKEKNSSVCAISGALRRQKTSTRSTTEATKIREYNETFDDIQKAKNQLGYIPNFNLEKGLYNHLKWSIDNL